jgi:hypothetical protein
MNNNLSNIINIPELLNGLEDYAIIKMTDSFPNYTHYDDLDIICKNSDKLRDNVLKKPVSNSIERVNVTVSKSKHTHIDYYIPNNNILNFRLDLSSILAYSKFYVDSNYINKVLERKEFKLVDGKKIYIPNKVDDLVIRFFEWIQYPHKEKHYHYVIQNIDDVKDEFIDIILTNTHLTRETLHDAAI